MAPVAPQPDPQELPPEEIDRLLEELVAKDNKKDKEDSENSQDESGSAGSARSNRSDDPAGSNSDYFADLQNNIKKIIFCPSVKEENEEPDPEYNNSSFDINHQIFRDSDDEVPKEEQQAAPEPVIDDKVREEALVLARAELNTFVETLPVEVQQRQRDFDKLKEEDLRLKNKYFMQSYSYMDLVLNKIVYDFLNSKQRLDLNKNSANGFNQQNVETYCKNNFKIFSLFLQGNIFSPIWKYKDIGGEEKGPFMSYDMDLFNAKGDVFTENVYISYNSTIYLPHRYFIFRSPVVEYLVQNYPVVPLIMPRRPPRNRNPQQNRKVNFHKKKNNANVQYQQVVTYNKNIPEEQNFPKLGDQTPSAQTGPEAKKKEEAAGAAIRESPLLDALMPSNRERAEKAVPQPAAVAPPQPPPPAAKKEVKVSNGWEDEEIIIAPKDPKPVETKTPAPRPDSGAAKPGLTEDVTSNIKKLLGL